jgi:hypothetical protein
VDSFEMYRSSVHVGSGSGPMGGAWRLAEKRGWQHRDEEHQQT